MPSHIVTRKRYQKEDVLVNQNRLSLADQTWEPLDWVAHLNPTSDLEDKVHAAGEGNVTIPIDQLAAKKQLEFELFKNRELQGEYQFGEEDDLADLANPLDPGPSCPNRHKKTTQWDEFCYEF